MSKNNQVMVIRKGDMFYIYENPCMDNKFKPSKDSFLGVEVKLKDALNFARKYAVENMVKYGICYDGANNYEEDKERFEIGEDELAGILSKPEHPFKGWDGFCTMMKIFKQEGIICVRR